MAFSDYKMEFLVSFLGFFTWQPLETPLYLNEILGNSMISVCESRVYIVVKLPVMESIHKVYQKLKKK